LGKQQKELKDREKRARSEDEERYLLEGRICEGEGVFKAWEMRNAEKRSNVKEKEGVKKRLR